MKCFLKKLFKARLKWEKNLSGDVVITCPECFAESILQNVYHAFGTDPDRWQPFCPYCNMIIYIDGFTYEEMFKQPYVDARDEQIKHSLKGD